MEQPKNDFVLEKVLKVYKQQPNNNYYIEMHGIMQSNKLGPGRALTRSAMVKIVGAVNVKANAEYFSQPLLDPRLLAVDPIKHKRHIIWYDKPKIRELLFIDGHSLKTGMYSTPGFIYFLHLGKFRCFAIKNPRQRPDLMTQLYHPPLFNTIGDFQFCWGSVKTRGQKSDHVEVEMKQWEEFLWNSRWSHGQNVYEKLYKATDHGKKPFNTRTLASAHMNLKTLIYKYL